MSAIKASAKGHDLSCVTVHRLPLDCQLAPNTYWLFHTMSVNSQDSTTVGARRSVTPIFGLPIGDENEGKALAPAPVRLHLPHMKLEAVPESGDEWKQFSLASHDEVQATATRELEAALQLLVKRAVQVTGATGAIVALPKAGVLSRCFAADVPAEQCRSILRATAQFFSESVKTRQVILINDAAMDSAGGDGCWELKIGSLAVMPLLREQELRGRIEVFSRETQAFAERDLAVIERIGNAVQVALDLAEAAGVALESLPIDDLGPQCVSPANATSVPQVTQDEATEPRLQISQLQNSSVLVPMANSGSPPDSAAEPVVPEVALVTENSPSVESVEKTPTLPSSPVEIVCDGSAGPAEPKPILGEPEICPAKAAIESQEVPVISAPNTLASGVQNCRECGFPVSEGRLFCLDCQPPELSEAPREKEPRAALDTMPEFLLPDSDGAASSTLASWKSPIVMGVAAISVLIVVLLVVSHFF
jgi:hypothetical protein